MTVVGAAAELVVTPCSHALAMSSYPMVRLVFLLAREVSAMQAPVVPTIPREGPQEWASRELVCHRSDRCGTTIGCRRKFW